MMDGDLMMDGVDSGGAGEVGIGMKGVPGGGGVTSVDDGVK